MVEDRLKVLPEAALYNKLPLSTRGLIASKWSQEGVRLLTRIIPGPYFTTPCSLLMAMPQQAYLLIAQEFEADKNIDIFTDDTHIVEFSCTDAVRQPIDGNPTIESRHVGPFLCWMFFDSF